MGVTGNPVYQACVEAFNYTSHYKPRETVTVSLGTGRFHKRKTPRWAESWLEWVLAELLESPGEQQTEIAQRLYPEVIFYRIDTELDKNIGLDDTRHVGKLLEYGQCPAEKIDWEAILAGKHHLEVAITTRFGTNTKYQMRDRNILFQARKGQ